MGFCQEGGDGAGREVGGEDEVAIAAKGGELGR